MDSIGSERLVTRSAAGSVCLPASIEDSYVLSPLQEGMLFHSLYAPHHAMYVRQIILTLHEVVHVPALRRAWDHVFKRHPILRSSLRWKGISEPVQEVHARIELPFEQLDWRVFPADEHDERLRNFLWEQRRRGFELSKAPLMRLKVLRLADVDFRMVWTFHHILSDGYSDVLTMKELFAFYDSFCRGQELHLEDPPPYREHCNWSRQPVSERAEEYWREKLIGFTEPTPLGMGSGSVSAEDSDAELGEQSLKLPADLTARLKLLARAHDLTLSTMLQGAWALLLSNYSGQADVVFGGVRGCRKSALDGKGAASIVGPFINTLPIRVKLSPDSILLSWLKELRQQWVNLRDYEHTPLVKVLDYSELSRGTPLFESAVAYDKAQMNTVLHAEGTPEWQNRELRTVQARSNFPLTLAAYGEDEFLITVRYDEDRFEAHNIALMLERLRHVFEGFAENIEQKLSSLRLLTAAEERKLLYEWNETGSGYPRAATVAGLFEEQVKKRAAAVAVVSGMEQVSYG
ncbi:MAG: condensation domain-containing protein, partial [Pyrinomonadaceae bacterium]